MNEMIKDNKIKVFEVKSTTSRKFDELHLIFKNGSTHYPVFKINNITKRETYKPVCLMNIGAKNLKHFNKLTLVKII